MNRLLFKAEECDDAGCVVLEDDRATHIRRVLRAAVGDRLRVGLINGPVGEAEVLSLCARSVTLRCTCNVWLPPPTLDLILALPRPKVLNRLLAPLASLGVNRLFLTNAEKVERNYFDTHVIEPAHIERCCIEGLMQAGTTQLPVVRVIRRLRPFLEDELPAIYPAPAQRLLLHPRGGAHLADLVQAGSHDMVMAIGPEGGWSDYELALFETGCEFRRAKLGWRVLRSDVACLAVVGAVVALHRACSPFEGE